MLHEPDLPSDIENVNLAKEIDPKLVETLAKDIIEEHKLTQSPY